MHEYDCVSLLSGGLDSILAVKVIQAQGLNVKCLHFVTPYFGKPHMIEHWCDTHALDIDAVDVSEDYIRDVVMRPKHGGYGKFLNPCVDCKVFMLSKAKRLLLNYGADFIISGEVLGQRPMSQRRDALDIITRESDTRDLLLRPLSAGALPPTPMETCGVVDREFLPSISGRGRKDQLALAEDFGLKEIPQPAGGCKLAEAESCRKYLRLLLAKPDAGASDMRLADTGRQLWKGLLWMAVGRNKEDNETLQGLVTPEDYVFDVLGFPGPLAVARPLPGAEWTPENVKEAASLAASYSNKAVSSGGSVQVSVHHGDEKDIVEVQPAREAGFEEPEWDVEKKAELERTIKTRREEGKV